MHTRGNYTLYGLKKLTKSTNGHIYTCIYKGENAVLKIYRIKSKELKKRVLEDFNATRNKLKGTVSIPEIFHLQSKHNILIVEQHTGVTVGHYLKKDFWDGKDIEILQKCIDVIKTFPEDIPIDTNPYNFTTDTDGKIYFIDFMPPNPWALLENKTLRKELEKAFPSVKNAYKRKENRQKRYYINKFRIIKFLHYLDLPRNNTSH